MLDNLLLLVPVHQGQCVRKEPNKFVCLREFKHMRNFLIDEDAWEQV